MGQSLKKSIVQKAMKGELAELRRELGSSEGMLSANDEYGPSEQKKPSIATSPEGT